MEQLPCKKLYLVDTVPAPAVVYSDEMSLQGLDNENWDRAGEAEGQPYPVTILNYILNNIQQL